MENGVWDNFNLPEQAVNDLKKQGLKTVSVEDGVSRYMSGHTNGLAYRFFIHPEYSPVRSKIAKYEVFDEIEMVEWIIDRKNKPVERARMLPEELLDLSDPEMPRGAMAEAYVRFKQGLSAPGTPLSKWGVLSDGEIATLAARGIFSVEQFASTARARIVGVLPDVFVQAFERAIQFVNGKENRLAANETTSQIVELQNRLARQERENNELREQMSGLLTSKARGRPKKIITGENEE